MRSLVLFLLFCVLLSTAALAVDTDGLQNAVPDSAAEILGGAGVSEAADGGVFRSIRDWAFGHFSAYFSEAAQSAGAALAVALLCSTAAAAAKAGKTPGYALLGGALAIFGVCAGDLHSFLGEVTAALGDLSDFSKALLPTMTAAAAAAGKGASAAARYAVSALFVDILMGVGTSFVLPALYAYAAAATVDAALPEGAMGGPVKLIAWACKTLLTALTTVFTLAVTLSGVIAGSADKLAGSVAKTAISAALPVVGSILSDAADAYLAGAQLVRGAVGSFGLAAVLAVCVGPVMSLGLRYILFKAAGCIAEPFADGRLAGLLSHIASVYGMALGLVGSAGTMLFVSVSVGMGVLSG